MKKIQLIKEMSERIKYKEGVTPKEFVKFLEQMSVVYNQDYVKQIRYYTYDLALKKCGYLKRICDLVEKTEPHQNIKRNEIWVKYTINVFYCEEYGVFVYDYENYEFERVQIYCKKAPKWFRKGWEGMEKCSLTRDEFIEYYKKLNVNSCFDETGIDVYIHDLTEIKYLQLKPFKEKIDRYISENFTKKNVA